jgi:hypothetical protein
MTRTNYHRVWRRRASRAKPSTESTLHLPGFSGKPPRLTLEQYVEARRLAALPDDERPLQWEVAQRFGVSPACLSWALVRGIKRYDRVIGTPPQRWKAPTRGSVVAYWREVLCRAVDEARAQP